jgi:hypothetical protein
MFLAFVTSAPGIASSQPLALRRLVQADLPATKAAVGPQGFAIDRQSRIWIALAGRQALGRVASARACAVDSECGVTEFPLPDADAQPQFVAIGRRDAVWVTAVLPASEGRVYRFDPDTETFDRTVPVLPGGDGFSNPYDVQVIAGGHGVVHGLGTGDRQRHRQP